MDVSEASKRHSTFFKFVFFCVFGLSLMIGFYLTYVSMNISNDDDIKIQYIEKWTVTDSSGSKTEVGRAFNDDRAFSEEFTITAKLPDEISGDSVLYFMNRANIKVYINGELRKEWDRKKDTGIPGGSMKEFYMDVPLSEKDSGGELKMIKSPTDWNPMVVSETFITTTEGLYHYITRKYGLSFSMIVILFVAALITTITALVLRIHLRRPISMLYGALGILDIACWMLAVSQATPFVTGVYYADGLMGFLFCMMMPFALLIYVNSIQKSRYKKCHSVLFTLSLASFVFWSIMHFTGTILFQSAIMYIDSILGAVVLCVIITIFLDIKNGHIKDYSYTAMGFLLFMIMCICEIAVIILLQNDSSLISMIIGLFCLLILVALQQIDDIKKAREDLEEQIRIKNKEKEQMLIHIVQTLAGTIDAKDTYTKGHSGRVADYSKEIARRCRYSESELNDIYMMGLLHDIGKIGIPDAVINKPGKLTAEEYDLIKKHPVMGSNILSNIEEMPELSIGARSHHEKYDGKGYPDGIKGEDIPEQARIIAVADAYDAMTSYRSYREPMTQEHVRKELENGRGSQFDPQFADIMIQMISEDKDYKMREKK